MTSIIIQPPALRAHPTEPTPPLENGDVLTRPEFERRYDATPNLKRAELIEGVVYVRPPIGSIRYGFLRAEVIAWLGTYCASTPGVREAAHRSVRLDWDNMPQPEVILLVLPTHGGRTRTSEDGYVEGAPELVAEVTPGSESIDLHAKLKVYRRNGVREYLVWRVRDEAFDWFVLREGRYDRLAVGPDGLYRSETFPELWLDPTALTREDRGAALATLRQGLASPEHAAFAARLAQAVRRESS